MANNGDGEFAKNLHFSPCPVAPTLHPPSRILKIDNSQISTMEEIKYKQNYKYLPVPTLKGALFRAGFVLQGSDVFPRAPSGRFLLFFWWLFVMILTSMYTANLTAHLTLERTTISIASLVSVM